MKYISENRLSDFDFHDGKFVLESLEDHHLTVNASFLNIHKTAEQNPFDTDMEIANARITFRDFCLQSYESVRPRNQDGTYDMPQVVLWADEARSCFSRQLEAGITVFDLGIFDGATYYLDALGQDPFFTVRFTFDSVVIEWDDYKKEAWYESLR